MRNVFNIMYWWYLIVSQYPRLQLSLQFSKAWQCITVFSNWISQVCLFHADDFTRWVDCLPIVIQGYHNTYLLYYLRSLEPLSELLIQWRREWWRMSICSWVRFWWICTHWRTDSHSEQEGSLDCTFAHTFVDRRLTGTKVWCVKRAIFRSSCESIWFLHVVLIHKNRQGNCSVKMSQVRKQPTACNISFNGSFCYTVRTVSFLHLRVQL